MDLTVRAYHKIKLKESEKKDEYLNLARELEKKTMEHKSDGDTNGNLCTRYSHQRIDNGTGGLGNMRTSGDLPNDSIIKIGQNPENNPGDLRRHTITQTPMEDHQLILVKNSQKNNTYRHSSILLISILIYCYLSTGNLCILFILFGQFASNNLVLRVKNKSIPQKETNFIAINITRSCSNINRQYFLLP